MAVVNIPVKELLSTDVIVLNPSATPVHVIRQEELTLIPQKYGVYYTCQWVVDGKRTGRVSGTMRYTDLVWVER